LNKSRPLFHPHLLLRPSLLGKGGLNKTFKHLAGYYRFFKELKRRVIQEKPPETPSSYVSL